MPLAWPLVETGGQEALLRVDQTRMPFGHTTSTLFVIGDDLFHPGVPDGWIDLVVMIAWALPDHRFLALTKHRKRARLFETIFLTDDETTSAMRLAIASNRGAISVPQQPFRWPLPNLSIEEAR